MKFSRDKGELGISLCCGLLLVASCSLFQDELPKEPDSTNELIRQWSETVEAEQVEPSGLWIPFSPEINIDSLMKTETVN